MATENDNVTDRMNAEANEGMKTYTFKFKIDAKKFAANFGVDVPDDSADETLGQAQDCGVREAVAEDADVNFDIPNAQRSSLYGQCAATLAQCKAKNPMTCPYHGMKAVAGEIEGLIRSAGVNGKVTCTIDDVNGGLMSVTASVVAAEADEKAINDAMQSFFKMPGVTQGSDMFYDDADKNVAGIFEIDSLDPKAQARWAFGAATPTTQQQAQPQPQPQQPTQQPVQQPVAQPQPPQTSSAKPTRTRTRKRSQPKSATAAPVEIPTVGAEEPKGEGETVAIDMPGEDDPVLYPNEKPPKPPDYKSPFTDAELDSLDKMMVRLDKTARQINRNIEKNNTDAWLAKTAPNLPTSLQKFKNEVDGNLLDQLAAKDTDGQVKSMKDMYDAIVDSEANGWKKKVAENKWNPNDKCWWDKQGNDIGNVDIKFDRSKYDDPYAKEREAYKDFTPGSDGRKRTLESLKQIDDSKQKNAPKDAAERCRKAAQDMRDIEDAFDLMKIEGIEDDDLKKVLGQAYYKANDEFKDGEKTCKEWIGKQKIAQDTIGEVIEAYKQFGIEVPAELDKMQEVEDEVKDRGWKSVARYHGLNAHDKTLLTNFRNNIRAYFLKCPTCSSYNIDDICNQILDNEADYTKGHRDWNTGKYIRGKVCKNNHCFHASNRSYVTTQNAVFGLNESRDTKSSKVKMHAYGTVCGMPFCEVPKNMMYQGESECCTILVNPKQAPIAFFGEYSSTAWYFTGSKSDPKNRNYTGSYVNNANPSMFANSPSKVSIRAFTEDLSNLDFDDLQKALGFHHQTGEAWMIGGIHEKGMLAIKEQYGVTISKDRVDAFNAKGITILDDDGKLKGKNLIPDDPDLIKLVWGKKGKPK